MIIGDFKINNSNTNVDINNIKQQGYTPIQLREVYIYGDVFDSGKLYLGRFADTLPFMKKDGKGGFIVDSHLNGMRLALNHGNISADILGGFDDKDMPYQYGDFDEHDYLIEKNRSVFLGLDAGYKIRSDYDINLYGGIYQVFAHKAPIVNNPFTKEIWGQGATFIETGFDLKPSKETKLTMFIGGSPNMKPVSVNCAGNNKELYNTIKDRLALLACLDIGQYNPREKNSLGVYSCYFFSGMYSIWNESKYKPYEYFFKIERFIVENSRYNLFPNMGAQGWELGLDWAPIRNTDWHLSLAQVIPVNASLYLVWSSGKLEWDGKTIHGSIPFWVIKFELTYYF